MKDFYTRDGLALSIVVLGFEVSSKLGFDQDLKKLGLAEKYEIEYLKNQFNFDENVPDSNKEVFLASLPVATYIAQKGKYLINIFFPEKKITITNTNFNENNNDDFENFVNKILDSSISFTKAIGINYNAVFTRKSKLKLFNSDIEKTEFFQKNISFSVTIPAVYDSYKATYMIQKINTDDEEDKKERKYSFHANYHIDLSDKDTQAKCDTIKKYVEESSKGLFSSFVDTYDEFLSLGYEKE